MAAWAASSAPAVRPGHSEAIREAWIFVEIRRTRSSVKRQARRGPAMRKPYPSDLTDEQWALIEPLMPPAKPGGRPRKVDMREVLNTLFYQARTGCQWDFLPHDLLPKSTVYDYFARWHDDGTWQKIVDALRGQIRDRGRPGRDAQRRPASTARRSRPPRSAATGLRRRQEGQGPQASHRGGHPGVAAGGGGDGGQPATTARTPRRCWASSTPDELPAAGGDLRRQQVQQPSAGRRGWPRPGARTGSRSVKPPDGAEGSCR